MVRTLTYCMIFHFMTNYPQTSFSFVTSENVGASSQKLLSFRFNLFAMLVQNFKLVRITGPKLLNLSQDHPSNKKVVIISLIEMLELPNFGHMNTSTI